MLLLSCSSFGLEAQYVMPPCIATLLTVTLNDWYDGSSKGTPVKQELLLVLQGASHPCGQTAAGAHFCH